MENKVGTALSRIIHYNPPMLRLLLILLLALPALPQNDANDIVKRLRPEIEKHTFLVRGFYQDLHLDYDSGGNLLHPAKSGSWTTAWMFIKRVDLKNGRLELDGERAVQIFQDKQRRFDLPRTMYNMRLTVEIAPQAAEESLRKALATIFVSPGEPLAPMLPDYWQWVFAHLDSNGMLPPEPAVDYADLPPCPLTGPFLQHCRPGREVTIPKDINQPRPYWNKLAHALHMSGSTALLVYVDKTGHPQKIEIHKPLGCGLDEDAIAAVRDWTFQPATRNGQPMDFDETLIFNYAGQSIR